MINQYFGLLDWQFYFGFFYFCLSCLIAFYFPGIFFISKLELNSKVKFLLSFVLGMVLWVLQGLIFGFLNFRIGTYFYLVIFSFIFLLKFKENLSFIKKIFFKNKFRISYFLIIFLGFFTQMIAIFSSGLKNKNGISFYFSNGTDAVMHLTFIKGLVKYFPPLRMDMFPAKLTGYHYFTDFLMAEIARVFKLPIIHLFFHYFPILLFFLTSFLFVQLIKQYKNNDFFIKISLIFFYFSGELAYLFNYYWHGAFGVGVTTIDNGADQFLNMPFIFAKLIFISIFYLLKEFFQSKNKKQFRFALILLIGLLVSFKIYWAMFVFLGLGFLNLSELIKFFRKKENCFVEIFIVSFMSGILALIIFLSNNNLGGESGIFWTPLIWPKILLNANNLDFNDWFLRRQVFQEANNTLRIFLQNIQAITITILSILGIRILPFLLFPFFKFKEKKFCFNFLFFPSLIFMILGLNTTQNPGQFNTFNFLIVSCFVGIFLMIFLLDWLKQKFKNKYIFVFICFVLIGFSLPRPLVQIFRFSDEILRDNSSFKINNDQLELFVFLKKTDDKYLIQTDFDDEVAKRISYLPFFANRPCYFTGQETLDFQGMKWQEHYDNLKLIEKIENPELKANEYKALNIHYFYLRNEESIEFWKNKGKEYSEILAENSAGILLKLK